MMDFAPAEISTVELADVCEPFVVPLAKGLQQAAAGCPSGQERTLDRGEYLYRAGQPKTAIFRLEAGIVCVTSRRQSGPPEVVEMLFPGSLLGLGFLERHIDSAMAVISARVTEFPLSAAAGLCAASPEAQERQAVVTDREFAARRRELVPDTVDRPIRRVAAFLSAIYHMNRQEGRNPFQVAEFLKTGDVAAFLDLDVGALGNALAELKSRGLVDRAANGGLVLIDPQGLERLSG